MIGAATDDEIVQCLSHQSPTLSPQPQLCSQCGTCCVAPDISTLEKPAGIRCQFLGPDLRCTDYPNRPAVCRGYRPDELCLRIAAATLEERVSRYLQLFSPVQALKVLSAKDPSTSSP